MGGKRRRGYYRWGRIPVFLIAFGLGLFLALTASLRLALVVAAIALVYVGITVYNN